MPSSLISLGANLGNTLETMRAASRLLKETFVTSEIRLSSILKTPPVGGPSGQGDFLNAIARIDHSLNVWEVWERIKQYRKGCIARIPDDNPLYTSAP
jgi:2-amino-4-hydroxy-6-hydroxymethyldihydropteridine diphosphokinase